MLGGVTFSGSPYGSTTSDTTPTFTGTAVPGAQVAIFVDGRSIGTTTARPDGTFSFTPTTPLALGTRTATAVQTTAAGTSAGSNANDFTIRAVAPAAPRITAPADGSTTADRTPVVRGTGQRGATVAVSIDGVPIGTAVVGADGRFTVPVTDPLDAGPHTVTAVQTDRAGNTSAADAVEFAVRVPVTGNTSNPLRPIAAGAQPETARGALADTGGAVA